MDTDTWWHLRAGEWILENRSVPRVDPFSYTRNGEPWQYPGWLVQIPMNLIYKGFGPGGLNLWVAGMVTLAYFFIWRSMEGGVFLKSFITVMAAATAGVYWAARPYMVTFLFTAIFLWILENFRERKNQRFWWLPILMVIWVNSHGGFAVGFILWGLYLGNELLAIIRLWLMEKKASAGQGQDLPEDLRLNIRQNYGHLFKISTIGVLMLLGVTLNPYGPGMILYPFKTVSIGALRDFIQEWQSPNFHEIQVQPFLWMLLLTFGMVGFSRKRLTFVDFSLISGFAYMGLLAGRNVALFALVAPIVLAKHSCATLEEWSNQVGIKVNMLSKQSRSPFRSTLNWILFGLIMLLVAFKVSLILPLKENMDSFRTFLPVEAVVFLRKKMPEGRLFNSYNWGAFLLWQLPEYPVFVDGRTDLYDDEIINQWFQVVRAEDGWQDVLDKWDVNVVLLESQMPIGGFLDRGGWDLLYSDDMAVIYVR
jgi:hypothetical protein